MDFFHSWFFDISIVLDKILDQKDYNNVRIENHILLLEIILEKSIEKFPLESHIVIKEKIAFFRKAFKKGKLELKKNVSF